jgi:hypothetical protein
MQTIPRGPSDVTSAWLGSVLGADVRDVDVTPIGTGQTGATYRASTTYATDTDLPGTFAIKLAAQDDTVRERVALGYLSEVEFYTDVAENVRIPVPRCFFSDISDTGADFVLLLADMAPAVQGDQIAGLYSAGSPARCGGVGRSARAELVRFDMAWPVRHLDAQTGRRGGGPRPR